LAAEALSEDDVIKDCEAEGGVVDDVDVVHVE